MWQVFLRTGVVPMRQKLVGFKGITGPLLWSSDLRAVGAWKGMKLMLIQMPPGCARQTRAGSFDHPLFLITYPYIAQCMGAWRAKGT